jgi:flagellin
MIVQHNITSMNANRQLGIVGGNLAKATEKLASGYKVNRAADDAAGLAISEKMRSQVRGLNRASDNAQDGISLIQTAEGALDQKHQILQRTRELVVQASNSGVLHGDSKDFEKIQDEIDELSKEYERINSQTELTRKSF